VTDRTTEYAKPSSIEEHQNESKWMTWKPQMIWNVFELQEATQNEVVVGEVGTVTLEIPTTALFAIHVAMQWINFESIAKCSIVNEIVKSTNLKLRLLLSEDLRVVLIPLPHCFIPLPYFFVPLPQTLLEYFDLEPFFWVARDEATPWALRRLSNLMSSHLPGVNYSIEHGIPATCIT
jgi:hypothetical protein